MQYSVPQQTSSLGQVQQGTVLQSKNQSAFSFTNDPQNNRSSGGDTNNRMSGEPIYDYNKLGDY